MKVEQGTDYPSLQVSLETEEGRVLWGPQLVLVHVKDENDQVPHFSQAIYRVHLSQGTRPGESPGQPAHCKVRWALTREQRVKRLPESWHRDKAARSQAAPPIFVPFCISLRVFR